VVLHLDRVRRALARGADEEGALGRRLDVD